MATTTPKITRQNEELALIKKKFGNDVEDLRDKNDGWRPLDIRILLTPLRDSSGNGKAYVRTKLHIICPEEYPEVVPKLSLEETKGISNCLTNELFKMLQRQTMELRGEFMILELVQTVQTFLIDNNKPPYFFIPTVSSHSRLKTEFEELEYLGKGAFGDVLKVKNILDSRKYAIKRIPLVAKSHKLYKKMIREVELMSRLNHENVVRYYNSWIENAPDDMKEMDKSVSDDWSESQENTMPVTPSTADTERSFSRLSKGFLPTTDDSDSDDGIEFLDSNGDVAVYEEECADETVGKTAALQSTAHIMYIQMEFCGNFTLRTVIDRDKLRPSLLWRLFREILEGLCHIHNQRIIHRDLKPGNIFLDSSFRIKIGDFGQATKTSLAFRAQKYVTQSQLASSEAGTGTGEVGTILYVAPELMGNASKSFYNQKVDMYPLGIILFEMIHPRFGTEMERINTITSLRHSTVIIPESMPKDSNFEKTVQIIRWLMNHDATQRPTATDLLKSKLVPRAQLEVQELDKVVRKALASPQSKAHRHLVAKCLQQKSDDAIQHAYHPGLCMSLNRGIGFVKSKVVNVFLKHGAIEMDIPLLTPISKSSKTGQKDVKLMTQSGGVVVLPSNLRVPFARHIAMSGVNMIRRYSVDRVFQEKKGDFIHPGQNYKCSFDIITPKTGNPLTDAEILSVAYEITNEFPHIRDNICIRMNHTSLLRAVLIYCNVPTVEYADLFRSIRAHVEGRTSPSQFTSVIDLIKRNSKKNSKIGAFRITELLLSGFLVGGPAKITDQPALKCLSREKGKVSSMAKRAIRILEATVSLARDFGVTCPIYVYPGLPIGNNPASSDGIVWEMISDLTPYGTSVLLAVGERYDTMLVEFQKQAQLFMEDISKPSISGAGVTISLDRLVAAVDSKCTEACRAVDVCVCVTKNMCGELKDVANIMRHLWAGGIRSGIVEATGADEALELAKKVGAVHVILMAENGLLCVRSLHCEGIQERHVTDNELVECIQNLIRNDSSTKNSAFKEITMPEIRIQNKELENTISLLNKYHYYFLNLH